MSMRTSASLLVTALAFALALEGARAADPLVPAPPPPASSDKKPDEPKKGGPAVSGQTKARSSRLDPKATEKSLVASIKNQKQILELEDRNSKDYPKQAIALADFHWDLAEFYGNHAYSEDIEKPLYDAEQAKNQAAVDKWKREQQRFLDLKKQFQDETINRYRTVIKTFPKATNLDEIRYYLGYNLVEMKRGEEGVEVYSQIIGESPDSPYVPDALVNIGDYYFELNDFTNAQKLFQKAQEPAYQAANIYGYAVYKDAWCLYNLGKYKESLAGFLAVIGIADKRAQEGQKGAIPLRREAQNEIILPYSKVGDPEKGIEFFRDKVAPDRYLQLTGKLANLYTEQTEYTRSSKLLRLLMGEARKGVVAGQDQGFMVIQFQRLIAKNADASTNKELTVTEITELIRVWEEANAKAPAEFRNEEREEIKRLILEVAGRYHTEFAKTKEKPTLAYTQRLYDEYLRIFRKDENAYQISMNNALLMLATEKYEEAAAEFENVIAMDPDGIHADAAAERAVLAYLKTVQLKTQDLKREESTDLTPVELPPEQKRFVNAIDRWMAIVAKKGMNPDSKDNVPMARFASGKIYYATNHFEDAAKRFGAFLENHTGHALENDARRYLLSCYNLGHDVESLRTWANKFDAIPGLPQDLKTDIGKIKNAFNFQECFKFQTANDHIKAAECFEQYAKDYHDSENAPTAIYNASINYFDAKRVEQALQMQLALYKEFGKKGEQGQKALFAIGEMYRQTTVYDEASKWYEAFVKNHPKHPLAEKALRYASVYRKTLGHYKEAIANLNLWLRNYRKEDSAARVDLDIVLIFEKQEKWAQVVAAVGSHIKAFPNEPPGIRLQALNRRGIALLKLKKAKDAAVAFQQTIDFYKALDERFLRDLDNNAISAVAESHFNLGDIELQRARAIKLDEASDKVAKKQLQDKLAILATVKDTYEKVIAYNHPGWVIAASEQLGFAYQDLADAVENSPVPRSIAGIPETADAHRQEMSAQAVKIRDQAIFNYRRALETAKQFRWFNDYSEKAERAIAQLDLTDLSVKESRLRPEQLTPNSGTPQFVGGK